MADIKRVAKKIQGSLPIVGLLSRLSAPGGGFDEIVSEKGLLLAAGLPFELRSGCCFAAALAPQCMHISVCVSAELSAPYVCVCMFSATGISRVLPVNL